MTPAPPWSFGSRTDDATFTALGWSRAAEPGQLARSAGRGGPQHQISRVLKACDILPDDQRTGRAAGVACAVSGTANVVDAIVIVTAVRHQAPVVTSDPRDLTRIADSIGVKIRLFPT